MADKNKTTQIIRGMKELHPSMYETARRTKDSDIQ